MFKIHYLVEGCLSCASLARLDGFVSQVIAAPGPRRTNTPFAFSGRVVWWSSAATCHWRMCPVSNTWVAGYKVTGATRQTSVRHRLEIAQPAFSSLSHLWADHWLSRTTKLRLHRVCVCSSLTHCCEAWTLNRTVIRSINGFSSRCLHVMTGEHYQETATAPAYNLVLAVRRRCLRYLGHVLRMPADRMVRCALMALVIDASHYPTGSLFSDCQGIALPQLVAMVSSHSTWRANVASLSWT